MADHSLEVLKLSVLFDNHFFNGAPTQVHFIQNSTMVGTWVDEQGAANLSVGLDRIQFMSSDQLAFLIAHEYGHLVLKHPQKTQEIQHPEGTLRLAKIKAGESNLIAEDFSDTFSDLAMQLSDAEVLAALVPSDTLPVDSNDSTVKAVVESWPVAVDVGDYAGDTLYGFEVSVLLTVAVLACALPRWWRRTRVGQ